MTQLIKIRDVSSKYDISAPLCGITIRWASSPAAAAATTPTGVMITFKGRLYAAAMSIDGDGESCQSVYLSICQWVERSGFALDERPGHCTMCHMLNPSEELHQALGYDQMDIYVPIRIKA